MFVAATMPHGRKIIIDGIDEKNAAHKPMKKTNSHPTGGKKWTKEQMTKAMELTWSGIMSHNKVAKSCDAPKSILKD